MKQEIRFYPVGNGDTSQIVLNDGRRLLFDFHHLSTSEDNKGPEINLASTLKDELASVNHDYFDVVAFTHGDKDHIENSTSFFELNHASKYQSEGRIKIKTLWVPAAMILETATNDEQSEEFVIWRQEARFRLKQGKGIRVFSKPERLKEWLEENDLTLESRRNLITDAGQIAPDFNLTKDGVEFFCHSPFKKQVDEREEFRNEASLIFNIRFKVLDDIVDYFAIGDTSWEILEDIVDISTAKGNQDRLTWDLFNIPHHCSYLALSDEKGKIKTTPKPKVIDLLNSGKKDAFIVSSSKKISDDKDAYEATQPPHIQAKNAYIDYLEKIGGRSFLVTMEESPEDSPKLLVFTIDENGLSRKQARIDVRTSTVSKPAVRVG